MNLNKSNSKTYEHLREELLQWQNRRYLVFSSTIVVITALIGWIVTSNNEWNFYVASILPLLIIIGSSLLTRNSSIYTVKIGTYFRVFLNNEWEVAQCLFNKRAKLMSNNKLFALFYLSISILTNIIFYLETAFVNNWFYILIFVFVWLLTLVSLYYLYYKSYPRKDFMKLWKEVKEEMDNNKL
jgi:uncharacterized membrane protein YdbT with pleckstrin-like domain